MADIFDLFRRIGGKKTPAGPVTHLVVGLGNPGRDYAFTRHNTGFLAVDYLSDKLGVRVEKARFGALVGEAEIAGRHILLVKPQTYMNASGTAVRQAADYYHVPPANILVICDDVNFPVGRMRVRAGGSDGGHNGLKSIIAELGSDAFPRLRIGVGEKPHPEYDLADWVLSAFPKEDQKTLFDEFATVQAGVEKILAGDVDGAMQLCNGAKPC